MKIRCNVCKKKFEPKKENMYFAHEPQSMAESLTKIPYIYECFDCPTCGHQIKVSVRMKGCEMIDE